jgi:subtilisin family serine protease
MTMSAAESGRFGAAFEWLGVERAWTRTRGSPGVLIAIVDEGVQLDHPLLGPNIHRERASHPASVDSYEIPGTHAAGVAAGRHSDAGQFSGVAPGASILPVRFASRAGTQALDLAHAIEYAVEAGASIINVSHVGDLSTPGVQRAIQYAATRNALVVCSAQESGAAAVSDGDMPNLLRVLAVDEQARPLANYGGGGAHLAAPGFARVPHWRGNGHSAHSSPAIGAPYVSGCAALVKSLNPGWGYHEIKEHLLVCGTPQEHLGASCQNGQVLNVANAVLGPLELADDTKSQTWSSLNDATVRWRLRYRSALCVNAVALYRPHGDEHWRELASARAAGLRMEIPAASLRRSAGVLRISFRDANFHADDIELTIR